MKTKLDLNKLFKNRSKKHPVHTITTTVYYKDNPEEIFRTTIAVVKIPEDVTLEIQEFWAEEVSVDDFLDAFDACLKKYPKAKVFQIDRPVPLEKCPCAENGCSGYLTNLILTKDLKHLKGA
jgi:hypothetical protein